MVGPIQGMVPICYRTKNIMPAYATQHQQRDVNGATREVREAHEATRQGSNAMEPHHIAAPQSNATERRHRA